MIPVFWKTSKSVDAQERTVSGYSPAALEKTDVRDIFITALQDPDVNSSVRKRIILASLKFHNQIQMHAALEESLESSHLMRGSTILC